MARNAVIENTGRFRLLSLGNGAAYEMTYKDTGEVRFCQYGDDAVEFRRRYDGVREAHGTPGTSWFRLSWDECLARLFDELPEARDV